MGYVSFSLQAGRYQERDNGRFAAMVERATDQAAYQAARRGASEAKGILGNKWRGACEISAEGGGGSWEIVAEGPWAEAAEFGIPGHQISTDKWSLFNPEENFPRNTRQQLKSVWHTGVPEMRMIESAGDIIANEFEGILISYLP